MAKNKKVIKEILKNLHWNCIGFQCDAQSSERILSRVSSVQWALIRLRLALKINAISMQIFQYFFDNFFVFSQWQLIFYKSNINTSLYRFLLKIFNFGIYTSLPFLVRYRLKDLWIVCFMNILRPYLYLCLIIGYRLESTG